MGKIKLLFIPIILASIGCSEKKTGWTRTAQDSLAEPGAVVIGADKAEVEAYLEEESLSARQLGTETKAFDIGTDDIESLKERFKSAKVLPDFVYHMGDRDPRVVVSLTPEEAAAKAKEQLDIIDVSAAQEVGKGKGVLVGIIDSGINVNRFDVKGSVWANPNEIAGNGIDDDGNGLVDDVHGWNFADNNDDLLDAIAHGTMSAALIASPLTGIAPEAKVVSMKVAGSNGGGSFSTIVEAILYARSIKVDIINLSMGSGWVPPAYKAALNDLMEDDILLLNSAGNSIASCEQYPANVDMMDFSKVMTVAATQLVPDTIQLAWYSNHGECVDIAAPAGQGPDFPELYERGIVAAFPYHESDFALYYGTSAAAPVMSGVAALVKSVNPKLNASFLKVVLEVGSTQEESLDGLVKNGRFINAKRAVDISTFTKSFL